MELIDGLLVAMRPKTPARLLVTALDADLRGPHRRAAHRADAASSVRAVLGEPAATMD